MSNTSSGELNQTPLWQMHKDAAAKMVDFAGYDMPVQYPLGVLKEHMQTRDSAGLFDVSHMGQLKVSGNGAKAFLETLLPTDLDTLADGEQRYSLLLNEQGGIIDDLMISHFEGAYLIVVNAACKASDLAWMQKHCPADVDIEVMEDRALLALQGPEARAVMEAVIPELKDLFFMQVRGFNWQGAQAWASCSGYTGEDGYEVSVPADQAQSLAQALLDDERVQWIGLGARDSLRLEAGLCLYGHDLNEDIDPISASLTWAISPSRRPGAERGGGYIGAEAVAERKASGPEMQRALFAVEGRAPVREGAELVNEAGDVVGRVCSGGFGPTVAKPVLMAYVQREVLQADAPVFAALRGRKIGLQRQKGGFVASRYRRG